LSAKFELGNSICVENITLSQLDCAIMRQWMAGKAWTSYVYLKLWYHMYLNTKLQNS